MGYVEPYGGLAVDARRRRKPGRRSAAPAPLAARPPSPGFDDWRSSHENTQFSPYRHSRPDIQSAESRTSSKEWSRTDSSRAPASTMPSSLHTSHSSHRGPHGAVRYKRGKPGRSMHGRHEFYDEEEWEDRYDHVMEVGGRSTGRQSGSRVAPSPRPSTRRPRSEHAHSYHRSYAGSRARSSRHSITESEDSEEDDDDDDGRYGEESDESEATSEESFGSDELGDPVHDAAKMPTIPEHDSRERERAAADRLRARSNSTKQPLPDDEGLRDENVVVVEEENAHAAPDAPPPPVPDETVGPEAEDPPPAAGHASCPVEPELIPQPHHQQAAPNIPDAPEQDPVPEEFHRAPHHRSRRSRTKYPDEEIIARLRHSRRKSRHADLEDYEEDRRRYARRPRYPVDDEEAEEMPHRDRHRSRHSARARLSSPPHRYEYSPERSRLGSSHKSRRRRSSMDDIRPPISRSHRHRSEDQIYATPPRRAQTSGPHMASSYSVSASKRSSSFLSNILGKSHHLAEPSGRHVKKADCVVCMDSFPATELPKLKCGHRMCPACLERAFKLSLTDPGKMPPTCCGPEQIPLSYVDRIFDKKFKAKWNRKLTEYTMKNPTYCPSRKCGALIRPENIIKRKGHANKMGTCHRCETEVCTTCKAKWHKSKPCAHDVEANRLLGKAKEEGWPMQQCFKCKNLVELKEGCNHMKCRCGADFCMLCGTKWKRCDCPWFNYDEDDDDALDYLTIDRPARNGNPFAPTLQAPRPADDYYGSRHPAPPISTAQPLRPSSSHRPGSSHRNAPPPEFEEVRPRRRRRHDADEVARRPHGLDAYDDNYEFVDDDLLDVVGIGNQAGHLMNEDYRMAPVSMDAPPISAHPPSLPRAATAGATYFPEQRPRHNVKRRASSLERRLADRFSDTRPTPIKGSGAHTAPPRVAPPITHMGQEGALVGHHAPPSAPAPPAHMGRGGPRRHAVEEEVYHETPTRRPRARDVAPQRTAPAYIEERGEKPRRRPEPPKSSVLAGLTGEGRGMNRVFEWRTHVFPGSPDDERTVALVR